MCRRFLVSGKVQGVFFRASTARVARAVHLNGHAVNLPDGRVEVVACGAEEAIETLRDYLHEGPPSARVDAVGDQAHGCTGGGFVTG